MNPLVDTCADPHASDDGAGFTARARSIERSSEPVAGMPRSSAIYEGWVRHRRHAPHAHAFSYRMYMLYLDLSEIPTLFEDRWLWSSSGRNLAEFRRSDFFGEPSVSLEDAVRSRVASETGLVPRGPIRLLAHLRYFGYSFNPVTFYYCFAEDGVTLEAILAEITNTPWKERHAYVLPVAQASRHGTALRWDFPKAFHVSPFMAMKRDYAWRFTVPADNLRIHMDVIDRARDGAPRELDATLVLERHAFNGANLARVLARHPFMTAKVVAAIHWQALRIYARGNPVHDHPPPTEHSR